MTPRDNAGHRGAGALWRMSTPQDLGALHPRGCQSQDPLHPHPPQDPPLTSLEAGLQHIWRDGHGPVEDPRDAPSHQDPRHTELTDTAEHQPQSDRGCEGGAPTIPPAADGERRNPLEREGPRPGLP